MSLLSPQVVAFIAVIEEGSFDRAAKRLSVTPSAVSQRIKQLEDKMGQLLVVRQFPCKPTPSGEQLLSRVQQMALLESEVTADLLPDARSNIHSSTFSIAVNEDSLSTWLLKALAPLCRTYNYQFDIRVDNEDFTLEYLKNGHVIGALTCEARPLQGCVVHELGKMRYVAVATPALFERYFCHGLNVEAFQNAPMIDYDHKDFLQRRFIRTITGQEVLPRHVHYLPSATGIVEAALLEMGWCVTLEGFLGDKLKTGQLIDLAPNTALYAPLYWQHVGIRSRVLSTITNALITESKQVLYF
ncbi:LysR family transcriptional regulator ArgP [Vibrio cholerae]|uniref:LysR family transcriptional regulator ArgP n=1 Tax=Vibrio cholerae TaxID=666 RepID=UPI0008518A77|nr:LysR family transcriptional regulator ArgP [Vibrio cholerae]EGQ7786702.1 LysR family transcriptional regulator ArgP [Vibrio cholerae]EGR0656931.1 LysR family transcriptional regulator ArgP [Vibrio cholerae]EGR0891806.1 LysR family transcriptional regulator ArgP [Vibrio cholerae]EGR1451566.1 LysR family transcriptional regulator ArgP [Vibrio cholerae]EIC9842961.1 LysR family transcriptional regulator ArgP [Vibrio cholerae]